MFLVYSFLYSLAVIVLFIPEYLKRPQELRRIWLKEKLGILPQLDSSLWVHAVSVGEVNAAMQLIIKLRKNYSHLPVILSTVTDTGRKVASERVPEGVTVVYLPFDLGHILERAFRRVKPKMLIIIETELWPNLLRYASAAKIPVLVLNGRISEKSSKGYSKISFFMKRVLNLVNVFGMQSSLDAERLKSMGADEKKVQVTGNFKFDFEITGRMPAWAEEFRGSVIIAGSTHKGEEELILSAYLQNLENFPELKLIIAPRHPQRFREVSDLLNRMKIQFARRSELGQAGIDPAMPGPKVLLLDSVGELSFIYGIADIVLIGKSFTGIGGQNPLEAAYWGKPVICGPHMENFPFMKEFYAKEGAFEVEPGFLAGKMRDLLANPEFARKTGENARIFYEQRSGAVQKAMNLVGEYLACREEFA
jgi:3-deoxy-D-manno-octulosonic-acid transferase